MATWFGTFSTAFCTKLSTDSVARWLSATGCQQAARIPRAVGHNRLASLRRNPLFSIIQAAGWPIWPLLACSVLGLALIIERFVSLKTAKIAPPQLLDEALQSCAEQLPSAEVVAELARNSALGEVLASGMQTLQQHPDSSDEDVRDAMENSGRVVTHRLERYLSALATIASVAPLMGLFGTVVGMIEIFGSQAPTGGNNPAQLAHGISIALYNTAFGLIIAIPSLIFWRYFRARVDAYLLTIEMAGERLLKQLQILRKTS